MSQPVPCGLAMPRWSVPPQPGAPEGIASTAGLVASRENVSVLPPLSWRPSERNPGSVFLRSPVPAKAQSAPLWRLWPSEEMPVSPQFDGTNSSVSGSSTVLSATIEFSTEIVPWLSSRPPPSLLRAPPSLLAIVELVTVVVLPVPLEEHAPSSPPHRLKIPPPSAALLPAIVESLTDELPGGFGHRVGTEVLDPARVAAAVGIGAEVVGYERVRHGQRAAVV